MTEQDRRPELLVHHPSKHPEYSGWFAYAGEQDERSRDLVAWTLKDLVEHSPEAAHPLREGQGKWRWDQAKRSYFPEPVRERTAHIAAGAGGVSTRAPGAAETSERCRDG